MKLQSVPVLESKACIRFFRKRAKKGNVFENFGKNVKIWEYFEKGQVHACACMKQLEYAVPVTLVIDIFKVSTKWQISSSGCTFSQKKLYVNDTVINLTRFRG